MSQVTSGGKTRHISDITHHLMRRDIGRIEIQREGHDRHGLEPAGRKGEQRQREWQARDRSGDRRSGRGDGERDQNPEILRQEIAAIPQG